MPPNHMKVYPNMQNTTVNLLKSELASNCNNHHFFLPYDYLWDYVGMNRKMNNHHSICWNNYAPSIQRITTKILRNINSINYVGVSMSPNFLGAILSFYSCVLYLGNIKVSYFLAKEKCKNEQKQRKNIDCLPSLAKQE